jgi:hypothetical protein
MYRAKAFVTATYIYFCRALFNHHPKIVRLYVEEVFHNIGAFYAAGNINFLPWPAFIAAEEAYEEEDLVWRHRGGCCL